MKVTFHWKKNADILIKKSDKSDNGGRPGMARKQVIRSLYASCVFTGNPLCNGLKLGAMYNYVF